MMGSVPAMTGPRRSPGAATTSWRRVARGSAWSAVATVSGSSVHGRADTDAAWIDRSSSPGWWGRLRAVDLLGGLVAEVSRLSALHDRVLVGIDGPDAAGKTTLADKLSDALDIPTVRASIDGFHRPREQRYERGELSPDGYYTDSFDYHALLEQCLAPFLGGSARVSTASYDHRARAEAVTGVTAVPTKAVLVFDGVFLLRPELRDVWVLSVYLRVSPPETLRRAHQRDLDVLGSAEQISRRYLGRYLPGQALYRRQADPEASVQSTSRTDQASLVDAAG